MVAKGVHLEQNGLACVANLQRCSSALMSRSNIIGVHDVVHMHWPFMSLDTLQEPARPYRLCYRGPSEALSPRCTFKPAGSRSYTRGPPAGQPALALPARADQLARL